VPIILSTPEEGRGEGQLSRLRLTPKDCFFKGTDGQCSECVVDFRPRRQNGPEEVEGEIYLCNESGKKIVDTAVQSRSDL